MLYGINYNYKSLFQELVNFTRKLITAGCLFWNKTKKRVWKQFTEAHSIIDKIYKRYVEEVMKAIDFFVKINVCVAIFSHNLIWWNCLKPRMKSEGKPKTPQCKYFQLK